jgi:hypothetical protein
MKLILLTFAVILSQCGGLFAESKGGRPQALAKAAIIPVSVYGADDRRDLFETDVFMRKLAESTVALFRVSDLAYDEKKKIYKLGGETLKDGHNLDDSQRFGSQPAAAFCSGALVGADTIITAGHCLKPYSPGVACEKIRIAFGYAVTREGQNPSELSGAEVYSCKQVLRQKSEVSGPDYALIKLDRKVKTHYPLAISRKDVSMDAALAVIGYPSGLPVKIAKNGHVRSVEAKKGYFVTDLDTFYGNSGSPVFNTKTMRIEGILVRGDTDYVYAEGEALVADPKKPELYPPGRVSVVDQDKGRGEDVTLISQLQKYIAPVELEKALDSLLKQKEEAGPRLVPAVYFPGSGRPEGLQPAVYYPEPVPVPAAAIQI